MTFSERKHLIAIVGPTAIGKTALAVTVAKHFQTAVLSADSRQFFKEMSIGTAKPTKEEMQDVPHFFVDNISIETPYNAGQFERDAMHKLEELYADTNVVVLAGGSGLYVDAVCNGLHALPPRDAAIRKALEEQFAQEGLAALQVALSKEDPTYYATIDIHNPHRVMRGLEVIRASGKSVLTFQNTEKKERPFNVIKIGLQAEREIIYKRINKRVHHMVAAGLVEEAKALHPHAQLDALQTVGYRELFAHFDGEYPLERAIELIQQNTRRFAKRQLTWYRKDAAVQWFTPGQETALIQHIESQLSKK